MRELNFGKLCSGKIAKLFVLENKNNMKVGITNFGGAVVSVEVPDKQENLLDVVLGYDDVNSYKNSNTNFGVLVGRYANRIKGASFTLDGTTY